MALTIATLISRLGIAIGLLKEALMMRDEFD